MAVYTTAVPVLNQTKIKTYRQTNTKTKKLLRPLIIICICVYTRLDTASTTPSDKDKVNAVDKRPVRMNLQNLQQKKGGRRKICKKDDPDDQQRQVAKFATKKRWAILQWQTIGCLRCLMASTQGPPVPLCHHSPSALYKALSSFFIAR